MEKKIKTIPNSLRKFRRLMGFKQSDVMKKLELKSTAMISRWERGLAMPSSDYLLKLSALYRTLPNDLYYEKFREYQRGFATKKDDTPCAEKSKHKNLKFGQRIKPKRLDRGP